MFSDCFASYRQEDFRDMDYILHRINHSVWFGFGNLYTNTVNDIKPISNSFSGLNFKLLSELENDGIEPKDYINDWLCFCLFIREIERNHFKEEKTRDYLCSILAYN